MQRTSQDPAQVSRALVSAPTWLQLRLPPGPSSGPVPCCLQDVPVQ